MVVLARACHIRRNGPTNNSVVCRSYWKYRKRIQQTSQWTNIYCAKIIGKTLQLDNLTTWPKVNLKNIFKYVLRMKEVIVKFKQQKTPTCIHLKYCWNKSIKISEIVVQKILDQEVDIKQKIHYTVGKEKISINQCDLRTNCHKTFTEEHLLDFFYSLLLMSPSAVLFKSIGGMLITTFVHLCITNITNVVDANKKNSSNNEKIILLLRKLCFKEKETQSIEKIAKNLSDFSAWNEHRKQRRYVSKHHKFYFKINGISKIGN